MIRAVLIAAAVLCLSGCSTAAVAIISPIATYVASLNNLGSESLKFIDDKKSCSPAKVSPPSP